MGEVDSKTQKGVEKLELERQYSECLKTLKFFGFLDRKRGDVLVPPFEKVSKVFTPEMINLAVTFKKPTLLLVPETSFAAKVRAVDTHKTMEDQTDTHLNVVFRRDDPGSETITGWKALIVEGADGVDPKSDDDLDQVLIGRIATRKSVRLKNPDGSVLERGMDSHAYIMLMMDALRRGRPIDSGGWTLLDDDWTLSDTRMPGANWVSKDRQVAFHADHEFLRRPEARFRSTVRVELRP